MRKFFLSILLATVAASPALAQDQGDRGERGHRGERQSERQQAREERQQARQEVQQAREQSRAERPERIERPQFQMRQERIEQRQEVRGDAPRSFEGRRFDREDRSARDRNRADRAGGGTWNGGDRNWTRGGDFRQSDRPLPGVMRTRNPLIVSETPREGTQPPLRVESRRRISTSWNGDWRRDRRYDWRGWRDRHRTIFRVGIYYDPFGWSYRPYEIGWRLWPSYYGRRYWIDDPWQYRLPYAPPGTVWVRYWNDALLVDTWSGEVIDAIHNFFW